MHATRIKKRIINNIIFIEGNLLQLIILIVDTRNINKNNETPIYNKWKIFKFERNKSHSILLLEPPHGIKQQQQQKHIFLNLKLLLYLNNKINYFIFTFY